MAKSTVYFTNELTPEAVVKMYRQLGIELPGKVAVKVHSGEDGNQNYLHPEFMKPVIDAVNGTVVECNTACGGARNETPKHIELMKKLIAHDVIIVASGCSAQAAARAGLMDKRAKDLCGAGLKRVCELADIPPVLHMGSCVDISRMMVLVAELAKIGNVNISQLPVVGCAPEWMSEKAVSIGNYVVATGIDTYLGVEPYVSGSTEVTGLLTNGVRDWVEAAYTVEKDIDKLGDAMLARIEEKRAALGV